MIAGELDRSVREIERKIGVRIALYSLLLARILTTPLGHADTRRLLTSFFISESDAQWDTVV